MVGARWLGGLENGDKGVFGGPAWWAEQRPLHGALWLGYAATAEAAYLELDVVLAIVNWFSNDKRIAE